MLPALPSRPASYDIRLATSLRSLAKTALSSYRITESELQECMKWRQQESALDRSPFYTVIKLPHASLTLLAEGSSIGFIVILNAERISWIIREKLIYFAPTESEPYYKLAGELNIVRSDLLSYQRTLEIAHIERLYCSSSPLSMLPASLSDYLEKGAYAVVEQCPTQTETPKSILAEAKHTWHRLNQLHDNGYLWNAKDPVRAISCIGRKFLLSFEDSLSINDHNAPSYEGPYSLLFFQFLSEDEKTKTRRQTRLKASDTARLALALLSQLHPSIEPFFDKVRTLHKTCDAQGKFATLKYRYPLYSRYTSSSHEGLSNTTLPYLKEMSPALITFSQHLLRHFPRAPAELSCSMPPEAKYAFGLIQAPTVFCHIFVERIEKGLIHSYHLISDEAYSCEQKRMTQGSSRELWRQHIKRLPCDKNTEPSYIYYHLVEKEAATGAIRNVFDAHRSIAALGLEGIQPAGSLVTAKDFDKVYQTADKHFANFSPRTQEAILVEYQPLGTCLENPRFEALQAPVKEAYLSSLATTVSNLHKCHVLHRDIKPENILLTDTGLRFIGFSESGTWSKIVSRDRKIPLLQNKPFGTAPYKFACASTRLQAANTEEAKIQLGMDLDWEAFSLAELEILFGYKQVDSWLVNNEKVPQNEAYARLGTTDCFLQELQEALKKGNFSHAYTEDVLQRARKLPVASPQERPAVLPTSS